MMTTFWGLIPSWVKTALAALVAAFLLLVGGYVAGRLSGTASTETKMERQNNEATGKALDAAHSYDECMDAGGVWTFRTGKCERHP